MSGPGNPRGTVPERSPIRVCIVAPSLDILGGQAIQAKRLLERLSAQPAVRVEFLPVNPRLPGPLRMLQRIKYVRTLVTETVYLATLLLRLPRIDVAHIFSASYFSFLLAPAPALLIARLFGKKTLLNYRSGEAEDHLSRWRRTALPVLRRADRIVVPSGYLVDVFARFGLEAEAIPNFVDFDLFRFRERDPLRPVFLANRNLEPLYNVTCVLDAFARIQRAVPEARLIVAGDGSERRRLEERAAALRLREVEFVGRVDQAGMARLYDRADIYLNAPDIDNMPGSILEAYAAGLPVVTTDAGGIPYIVEHEETGLLVPRGDDAALAEQALRLLADPALAQRLIRRAHEECRTRYSWQAVEQQWVSLYRGVLRDGRARTSPRTAAAPHEATARR